jgi:hypothetical protein
MTIGQHHIIHQIAGAMEQYGESAVFDVIARIGEYPEIIASLHIRAGMKLQRIAKYHTRDGMTFLKKNDSSTDATGEKIPDVKEGCEQKWQT